MIPTEILNVQPEIVEENVVTKLEALPIAIESVEVQDESTKAAALTSDNQPSTLLKPFINLHGAPVDLPEVELVSPSPLPTLTLTKENSKKSKEVIKTEKPAKVKKSTGGLCASCFGAKAKKKETLSETVKAPIDAKKVEEENKQAITVESVPAASVDDVLIVESAIVSTTDVTETIVEPGQTEGSVDNVTKIDIDTFMERNFHKTDDVRE